MSKVQEDYDYNPPRSGAGEGSGKKYPIWVPKHGDGTISGYFLRPNEIAARIARRGHFAKGHGMLWCQSCSEENGFGNFCGYTKTYIASAIKKNPGIDEKKAREGLNSVEHFMYPFYVYKTYEDKQGQTKEFEGFGGLELNYTAGIITLAAEAEKLGKRCRGCGSNGTITRLQYLCGECDAPVVWDEAEKKAKKKPFCANCKQRIAAYEVVECSKCKNGARLTVFDTRVTLSKLADKKTVDFEFEIPAVPPTDKELNVERYDLLDLVPYTPADQIMAAFGMSSGGGTPTPATENKDDYVDDLPF